MINYNTTIAWVCESAFLSLPTYRRNSSPLDTTKTYISIDAIDFYYDQLTNVGSLLHWYSCRPPIWLSTNERFGCSIDYDKFTTTLIIQPRHYTLRFGMTDDKPDPWNKGDPWRTDTKYSSTKPEPDLTPPPPTSSSSSYSKGWNNINKDYTPNWDHPTDKGKKDTYDNSWGKANRGTSAKPYPKKTMLPIDEYTPTDPFCYSDNTTELVPFIKSEDILHGFQAVSIIKRSDLDSKIKLAADDTNSFALFVGGNNPHFFKNVILPPHTILEMTMPATHPKDLNALLQGYLVTFGPRTIIPMTRTPDTTLSPSITVEHFTWVTQDHPDAAQLKLHPHSTWSTIITTQLGIPLPTHEIFNPRIAGETSLSLLE